MGTTTVRLDQDDERALDDLASELGGRSNAIRAAIHNLAADVRRRRTLEAFLESWDAVAEPVDESEAERMAERYGL